MRNFPHQKILYTFKKNLIHTLKTPYTHSEKNRHVTFTSCLFVCKSADILHIVDLFLYAQQKSPIHTQKSPMNTQKSLMHTQKTQRHTTYRLSLFTCKSRKQLRVFIYAQKSPIHTQKSPINTQKSLIYTEKTQRHTKCRPSLVCMHSKSSWKRTHTLSKTHRLTTYRPSLFVCTAKAAEFAALVWGKEADETLNYLQYANDPSTFDSSDSDDEEA